MSGNSIYIVRPNIGNPQILQVQDLDNIEITIAGTSDSIPKLEDIIADLNGIKLEYNNDNQSKEFPLAFKSWLNLPHRYIDDNPDLFFYDESLRLPLFPTSIIENQFYAGFRWEARIIVSLIGNRNDFVAKSKSTICNIIKDTRINYHSICIRKEMPNPEKINFFHVTDCHISGRNDLIPQLIMPVLEPCQKKIFKSRYLNYNDNLRAIIRYANQRAREGNLDFIIITGDLIDYLHDGYFSGDTYHYGQGKDAPTIPDNTRSNYTKFIEIITGTDNRGEELQVPVFTIPGNHEYYAYENLGAFNIDLEKEVPDWLTFIRVISTILFPVNIVLDLIAPEMYDLRKTGKVDDKVNDDIDKYGTFGLSKIEMLLYDWWKRGNINKFNEILDKYKKGGHHAFLGLSDEDTLSVDEAARFIVPLPHPIRQYISNINYDSDYILKVGKHQFVMLNSGQDTNIPSFSAILASETPCGDELSRAEKIAFKSHPYSRGYLPYHSTMVDQASKEAGDQGLVLLFNHAPFYNHPEIGAIKNQPETRYNFGTTQDLQTTPLQVQINQGDIQNDHFDYDFSEGSFLLLGPFGTKIDAVFEGHTHGSYIKRTTHKWEHGNYKIEWIYGNEDHYNDLLMKDKNWFYFNTPFFFNSGSLKARLPMCREVFINNNNIEKAKLNRTIPRLNQCHLAGPMASFLTAAVSRYYNIAGYSGVFFKNGLEEGLEELLTAEKEIDRELVMWDLMRHFREMRHMFHNIISYSGYVRKLDADLFIGLCDNYTTTSTPDWKNWENQVNLLLQCRNINIDKLSKIDKLNKMNNVIDEIRNSLKHISGWLSKDRDLTPSWFDDPENYPVRKFVVLCRYQRLLEANIWTWLDRFGYYPNKQRKYSIHLYDHFTSIDPNGFDSIELLNISNEREQRILDLFDFANTEPFNPLRLWYASESSYLAELGGYKLEYRNNADPSFQLKIAKSLPPGAIKADIYNKYQLQAEFQYKLFGTEGLRQFYSSSSARLAGWSAPGIPTNEDYYLSLSSTWNDNEILDALSENLETVIRLFLN